MFLSLHWMVDTMGCTSGQSPTLRVVWMGEFPSLSLSTTSISAEGSSIVARPSHDLFAFSGDCVVKGMAFFDVLGHHISAMFQ